jgi:glycosyltransferase involved in cell wall biosynthesis
MPRILLHGNAPWVPSGYGQQLGLLAHMLRQDGHEVAFSANWGLNGAMLTWNGFQVFPAGDGENNHGCGLLPDHARAWSADLVIALGDAWYWPVEVMQQIPCRLALWLPVDCEPLSAMDKDALAQLPGAVLIAMAPHGQRCLHAAMGVKVYYAPHVFERPQALPALEPRARMRELWGFDDDTFVLGLAAANKDLMRKGFGEQLAAFRDFVRRGAGRVGGEVNARLMIHAVPDRSQGGVDLVAMCNDLDILHLVRFTPPYALLSGGFDRRMMMSWYGGLDLLTSCSWGEGFGVPVIEAQAMGVPVVSTRFGAQKDLPAAFRATSRRWWIGAHSAWWGIPDPDDIADAYRQAYDCWQDKDAWEKLRGLAMARVQPYERDWVLAEHWRPILRDLLDPEVSATDGDAP